MGDFMRRRKNKEKGSLFAAQCIVSCALIVAGVMIYNSKTPFFQPAKVAFSQVVTENSGIEGISDTINAFAEKIGLLANEN